MITRGGIRTRETGGRRRQWHPTPVLLPGKSHEWRSLVGCSPWGRWESDTTEWLHFHFSLSCIGEGNGSPLQCSCLENPREGGAWWAAVYGVAQSWTRLKRLSSSSSRSKSTNFQLQAKSLGCHDDYSWPCYTMYGKLVKRIDPKGSHYKKKFFSFLFPLSIWDDGY